MRIPAVTIVGSIGICALGAFAAASASSKAGKTWDCVYASYGSSRPAEMTDMSLIQDGSMLKIAGAEFLEYRILEDNDVGIVAVRSYAEVSKTSKHLGADVLVIDKRTMDFRKGNVFVEGARADNTVRNGTCSLKR